MQIKNYANFFSIYVGNKNVHRGTNRFHRVLDTSTGPDFVQSLQRRTKTGNYTNLHLNKLLVYKGCTEKHKTGNDLYKLLVYTGCNEKSKNRY